MVYGPLPETFNTSSPSARNKILYLYSFVVFRPSADGKWLISVNKSCARGPLEGLGGGQ